MSVSGSIRKVLLEGISFNAAADGNPARQPTQENEGVRHSGGVAKKVTLMMGAVESLKLIASEVEYTELQSLAAGDNITMSYQKADGSVLRSTGFINLDNYEAEENSVEVTMTPETGEWETFAA